MILSIALLLLGFVFLTYGADYFVEGASSLAKRFKIPQIIIGLTIVAMGTSAPEAAVSINSALKGIEGIAIGNVLGSNIANIFLILGITSLIFPLPIPKNTIRFEIPFVIFITILTAAFGFFFGYVTRAAALLLLILFVAFLFYLYKISSQSDEEESKVLGIFKTIFFIVIGLFALIYGSELTVKNAINIAHFLNISDRVIGLTIVAIGTSLPELVVCVVAAFKRQTELAVGNIIGSNIFNILFVLGLSGVIIPIKFSHHFLYDALIAFIAVLVLFLYTFKSAKLSRIQGASFVLAYLGYILILIFK